MPTERQERPRGAAQMDRSEEELRKGTRQEVAVDQGSDEEGRKGSRQEVEELAEAAAERGTEHTHWTRRLPGKYTSWSWGMAGTAACLCASTKQLDFLFAVNLFTCVLHAKRNVL